MERSLSILLPVRNRQASLANSVRGILELAELLTEQLDLLIVDNGSTDATPEIAHDLAREFAQVGLVRFAEAQDLSTIVQAGLRHTHGEIILVHEGNGEICLSDLRNLWRLRDDELLVLARCGGKASTFDMSALDQTRRGNSRIPSDSGFQLLRRDTIELVRSGAMLRIENQQIRLRRDIPRSANHPAAARPNFLGRLKQLAWGE
ncbi:MAG: glycosyltransferase [Planctomycetales bacterium]|nr:glycosyltransferase [Planctomycetales bacterium]